MSSFSLQDSAFKDCFNLKNIIIPEGYSITSIDRFAFENCPLESFNFKFVSNLREGSFKNTKLTKVVLYSNTLENDVFAFCDKLLEVKIENQLSITNTKDIFRECHLLETADLGPLKKTCNGMFKNCFNLKEVKSSSENIAIEDKSFLLCINLERIELNLSIIGNTAFMFCKSLTSIDLTNTVRINSRAFYGCQNLTSIAPQVFGGEYAFAFCNSLISCNVQTFAGTGLMMNCSKLESVRINNIQYIPERMFCGCSNLKNIEFSDVLKSIGHYAFMDAPIEVEFLDLSETEQIGHYAFKGTKIEKLKLGKDFFYYRSTCDTTYIRICPGINYTDENPFKDVETITEITIGAEKSDFRAKDFPDSHNVNIRLESDSNYHIEDGMMMKGDEVIYNVPATPSNSLTIQRHISKIHPYAFTAAKLEEIKIECYIDIMEMAFYDNKYLKSITINFDQQTKTLDNRIFENCISLSNVSLCTNFYAFGEKCFRICNALETVIIPEGTGSLGIYCFAECNSLTNIIFPSNSVYISSYCFYKCEKFSQINLSGSINYGPYALDSTPISSFSITQGLNDEMFNMCDKLEKVEFKNIYIYSIPQYCFNSTNLSEINIPSTVYSLDRYCFGFTKLKKFVITESIRSIHPQAFYGVEDLKLELDCNHPTYLLGAHELIEKETNKLLLTYGKLLSTYIVPAIVTEIGENAINSYLKYNYETGKVIDFGVTTLVIRTKIKISTNPLFNAPYLHNLCYGGNVKVDNFYNVPRIFFSNNYTRSIWNQRPRKGVIFSECDSAVPFENYAKFNYSYPTNPRYIDLPNETIQHGSKDCPIINDPLDLPDAEPERNPKSDEINSKEEEIRLSSSQINSENIILTESNQSVEFIGFEQVTPSKTKSPLMMYILIAVSIGEILLIAWLIVLLISKKNEEISDKSFQEVSEHAIQEVSAEIAFTNPLFALNTTMEDDPFANDFEEGKGTYEGYFNENCLVDE